MGPSRTRHKTPRSSVACIKCRVRKVRCDVSHRGHPCLNCVLDRQECVVLPRSRKASSQLSKAVTRRDSAPASRLSSSEDSSQYADVGHETQLHEIEGKRQPVDVPFQAYPNIKADFLSRLPQEDIWYLESRSCFRLPVRDWWHDMLQVYSRHINPLVPLFNKANFLEPSGRDGSAPFSLFVAQAILFAACPFASQRAIKGCGFANCREARAAFYRRAKLLYRLESESNSVAIVQGSLLLSLCSTPQTESPVNSVWLSIAIQHARSMGAHHPRPHGIGPSTDWLHLKRLWWVCLIRDRILSLGYRRPLQIADEPLETELDILSPSFEEVCRSEAYPAPVMRALYLVFISLCHLCIPLTRILNLVIPTIGDYAAAFLHADDCAEALQSWHDNTLRRFEMLGFAVRSEESVLLHYHLLQIYFHTARLQILNFRIRVAVCSNIRNDQPSRELRQSGSEIESSAEAIIDSLSTLALRNLVEYLPTSAVMCTVLPFVLNAVSVKLVPPGQQTDSSKKRTEIFHDVTRALRTRYNNVNPFISVVEKVITITDPRESMMGWQQNIASRPGSYLRALRALDLLLSTGQFPSDSETHCGTIDYQGHVNPEAVPLTETGRTNAPQLAETMDDFPDVRRGQPLRLDEEIADSRRSDPFFYDILALCQGQDIDTLLNII